MATFGTGTLAASTIRSNVQYFNEPVSLNNWDLRRQASKVDPGSAISFNDLRGKEYWPWWAYPDSNTKWYLKAEALRTVKNYYSAANGKCGNFVIWLQADGSIAAGVADCNMFSESSSPSTSGYYCTMLATKLPSTGPTRWGIFKAADKNLYDFSKLEIGLEALITSDTSYYAESTGPGHVTPPGAISNYTDAAPNPKGTYNGSKIYMTTVDRSKVNRPFASGISTTDQLNQTVFRIGLRDTSTGTTVAGWISAVVRIRWDGVLSTTFSVQLGLDRDPP